MEKRTRTSLAKRAASCVLMVGMLCSSFAISPPKAQALLGVGDIVIDPTNLVQNTINAVASVDQVLVSKVLNGLAWSVAKMTVQSITRSTVNWINSGFNGSPAFVSDLRDNLSYLGDAVADDFLNQLDANVMANTGLSIRTPFQDQIAGALRTEYYRTTGSWGLDYTLNQYSTDPKAFLDGNFSQGGFNAYFAASQNDANNPFGAYRRAQDQLWAQIDSAQQQRRAELDWGKGFLPWRGPCAVVGTGSQVDLSRAEKCPFNEVRTPGSVVEDQLAATLGSGIRQLELADSINEIVGALMGQLVNQVLGSSGLSGVSRPAAGGGSSYINQATSGNQLAPGASSMADGVLNNISIDRRKIGGYQNNWQQIRNAAERAQSCNAGQVPTGVLIQADQAISRASTALSTLNTIEQRVQAAAATTNQTSGGAAIVEVVSEYQSFLSSSAVPSAIEIADAAAQVQDTSEGSPENDSLLTSMERLAVRCGR